MQCSDVAELTFRFVEVLLANAHHFAFGNQLIAILYHLRSRTQAARWYAKALHIKVDIFHSFRRNVESIRINKAHHAAVLLLRLSLANLFWETAIRSTHIA